MNPEQLLKKVEEAIKSRAPSTAKRYAVCHNKGVFTCVPVAPPAEAGIALGTYTIKELTDGLTTKQWGTLLTKLGKIKPKETS